MKSDRSDRTLSEVSDSTNQESDAILIEDKYTMQACMDIAKQSVQEKTTQSQILDDTAERNVPKFELSEFLIGRILGKGAFCDAREITKITLKQINKPDTLGEEHPGVQTNNEVVNRNFIQDRSFMEQHCLRGDHNDCRYAIKAVQDACKQNVQTYIHAVTDLAIEAKFLSVISHPNIIKMRAMAQTCPFSTTQPFFVVLDRLYDILGTRIKKWKKQKPVGLAKLFDCSGLNDRMLWNERITVLYDLAAALKYLHEANIMYRDIKPDNIGFDVRDDVKIFDFGLAKEYDPSNEDENGLYNMTSDTGSLRYMAPEVYLDKPYNQSVDVYSFATLMWQILKLETPYCGYTVILMEEKVYKAGVRMQCDPKWPLPIRNIIERGWDEKIRNRPDMDEIIEVLRNEMCMRTSVYDLDNTRKSAQSMAGLYPCKEKVKA